MRNTIKTWGWVFAIGLLGTCMIIIAFTTFILMIIDKFN